MNSEKTQQVKPKQTQQEFLREAQKKLGFNTRTEFAERLGDIPESTLKKWMHTSDDPGNYREMHATVWQLVREILEHEELKYKYRMLILKQNKNDSP